MCCNAFGALPPPGYGRNAKVLRRGNVYKLATPPSFQESRHPSFFTFYLDHPSFTSRVPTMTSAQNLDINSQQYTHMAMEAELSIDPSYLMLPPSANLPQGPLLSDSDVGFVRKSSLDAVSLTSPSTADLSDSSNTQLLSSSIDWDFGTDLLLDPFPPESNSIIFPLESDDGQLLNVENDRQLDLEFALDQVSPIDLINHSPNIDDSDPLARNISMTQGPETHDDPQTDQDSVSLSGLDATQPADEEAQNTIAKGSNQMTSPLTVAAASAGSISGRSLEPLLLPVRQETFAKICDQGRIGARPAAGEGPEKLEV
jgi:hypothetical protein